MLELCKVDVQNSPLSRIEKNLLALDSENFAAGKLVVIVVPVAVTREPSLTKIHIYTKHRVTIFERINTTAVHFKTLSLLDAFVNALNFNRILSSYQSLQ